MRCRWGGGEPVVMGGAGGRIASRVARARSGCWACLCEDMPQAHKRAVLTGKWGTEIVMQQYRKYEWQRVEKRPVRGEWLFAPGPRIFAEKIALES